MILESGKAFFISPAQPVSSFKIVLLSPMTTVSFALITLEARMALNVLPAPVPDQLPILRSFLTR